MNREVFLKDSLNTEEQVKVSLINESSMLSEVDGWVEDHLNVVRECLPGDLASIAEIFAIDTDELWSITSASEAYSDVTASLVSVLALVGLSTTCLFGIAHEAGDSADAVK